MAADPSSPEVLVSLANEVEAVAITGALADHGIRARVIGGYTSGFRAEAPGEVRVVVGQADMARAQTVLAEIQDKPAGIDWLTVDCGDDSAASDQDDRAADTDAGEASTQQKLQPQQFSIAALLALQALVSLLLGLWQGLGVALFSAALLFGSTLLLIVASTVACASDLNRGRQIWVYVGRLSIVGLAVVALLLVIPVVIEALGVVL